MQNNIRKKFLLLILICLVNTPVFSNNWVQLDSVQLAKTKAKIINNTASKKTLFAYNKLIKKANALLKIKNTSVTDKTILPPTGNKNDYLSISRYWWPDLEKKEGLPWIRKDGITNPNTQTNAVDRKRLGAMSQGVWILGLAYYFTENEAYAKKAISMMETWFLNPKTLMNPHLEFAQSVPGNSKKRRSGILDGRSIVKFVPDAIQLISTSKYWNSIYKTKMNTWLSSYLFWLTKSELGIKGSMQTNNHGSWYKYQVATLAYYLGDRELVKKMVRLAQNSLDDMLDAKGGQIHELARSRSFFYSCFNLQALVAIADLGNKVDMNMWQYQSDNKKSLALAIGYLTPVVDGEKWKHSTLKSINLNNLIPIISKAFKNFNTQEYKVLLSKIIDGNKQKKQDNNLLEFWLLNIIH